MILLSLCWSCKNTSEETVIPPVTLEKSDITELSGHFIYYDDASVFQTRTALYGVKNNSQLEKLITRSSSLKNQSSDEVFVSLKVKVSYNTTNPEVWEKWIEILEIINVSTVERSSDPLI